MEVEKKRKIFSAPLDSVPFTCPIKSFRNGSFFFWFDFIPSKSGFLFNSFSESLVTSSPPGGTCVSNSSTRWKLCQQWLIDIHANEFFLKNSFKSKKLCHWWKITWPLNFFLRNGIGARRIPLVKVVEFYHFCNKTDDQYYSWRRTSFL